MHIDMLPLKEKKDQIPINTDGPGYPASQNVSVAVSTKTASRTASQLLVEISQPCGLLQPGLHTSPALSYYTETGQ